MGGNKKNKQKKNTQPNNQQNTEENKTEEQTDIVEFSQDNTKQISAQQISAKQMQDNQSNKPIPSATDPDPVPTQEEEIIDNHVLNHQNLVDIQNKSVHSLADNDHQIKHKHSHHEQHQIQSQPQQNENDLTKPTFLPQKHNDHQQIIHNKQQPAVQQLILSNIEQPVIKPLEQSTEPIYSQTIIEVDQQKVQDQHPSLNFEQVQCKNNFITEKQSLRQPPNENIFNQEAQFDQTKYFKRQQRKARQKQLQQIKKIKKQFDDSTPFPKKFIISSISSIVATGIAAVTTKNRTTSALVGLATFALSFIIQK